MDGSFVFYVGSLQQDIHAKYVHADSRCLYTEDRNPPTASAVAGPFHRLKDSAFDLLAEGTGSASATPPQGGSDAGVLNAPL